jgi:lipoprotein-releasing system permease protein
VRRTTAPARPQVRRGGSLAKLEAALAWRYLRSRRGSSLLSLISVIAIGGVAVGVSALILIMGVMNGLQRDLREKILVGSPDIRVLTAGDDLRMERWRDALARTRATPGVVAAAPVVLVRGSSGAGRRASPPARRWSASCRPTRPARAGRARTRRPTSRRCAVTSR